MTVAVGKSPTGHFTTKKRTFRNIGTVSLKERKALRIKIFQKPISKLVLKSVITEICHTVLLPMAYVYLKVDPYLEQANKYRNNSIK